MRFVIQRVSQASVVVNNKTVAQIEKGLVVLVGIHKDDTKEMCEKWIDKILKLRIFSDDKKPINASIQDVQGQILLVSQFTLYANTKGQNRPAFLDAAKPDDAKEIYDFFVKTCKTHWPQTQTGEFGANMQVNLTNDGPVTIVLE